MVDKILSNVGEKMIMASYPSCEGADARNSENVDKYQECTNSISKSSSKIQNNIRDIEIFSTFQEGVRSNQTKLAKMIEFRITIDHNDITFTSQ